MKKLVQLIVPILLLSNTVFAQKIIEGVIKDSLGGLIVGATIGVKGTTNFVFTDVNGNFRIQTNSTPPLTLLANFVGFKPLEINLSQIPDAAIEITMIDDNLISEVTVTSRRRKETAQDIPIPISIIGGEKIEEAGAFNVNRVKELVPSVQLYSSNPRNTTLNIRGLGSTFGLTNDGIDPGVGFYVDGVYYARPAASTLDFIDIEQIEVLRGPQGTLFGKNTTAGTFNITTRKPSFTTGGNFELSYGNYGYIQAKSSFTGKLAKNLAGRLSFSGTQRDGLIENVRTGKFINDLNNQGVRGQLLFTPTEKINVLLTGDYSAQHPDGYAQVAAGVAPTQRAAYRQFNNIIKDLNYTLPSQNAFDRKVDHDTPWRSNNELGGASLNIDAKIGPGTLTSTTAYRFWNWDPSNDRDFTGLTVLSKSQATSKHNNWSQEFRYAGKFSSKLSGVVGVFGFFQELRSDPYQIEESGDAQARFSRNVTSDTAWNKPGLLNGYGIKTTSYLRNFSGAVFGQLDYAITEKLHILPGLRYNYDNKFVDFDRQTYGGLQTTRPDLVAIKNSVYFNQKFNREVENTNFSGQLTLSYKAHKNINIFATYSTSFKPVGVNLGGLPTVSNTNFTPLYDLAVIKPEMVEHYEVGIKTSPWKGSTVNFTAFNTDTRDFQTQVQASDVALNRGYLSNAEKVRVAGLELEYNIKPTKFLSIYGGLTYSEGIYLSFTNAPLPLEETGLKVNGKEVFYKDVSGTSLPGVSKWINSLGAEVTRSGKFFNNTGKFFLAVDSYYRSSFSSSASASTYLVVNGYALANARLGFRAWEGFSVHVWGRNITNENYYEQLLPAGGNAGLYAAVLGDQRTYGVTFRYSF